MCGIVGVASARGTGVDKNQIARMASVLRHRGPDDEGYLFINSSAGEYMVAGGEDTPKDAYLCGLPYAPTSTLVNMDPGSCNVAMAHRRLSILDLSPAGHQPMSNESGSLWIVHNGEVYNYVEIREELKSKGHRFRSATDTEVIIKAYEEWGHDCLTRFNGMWAFCIWDSVRKEMFCARDRFGIKPFYYYFDGMTFAFASEIKALLQTNVPRVPNESSIRDFLRLGMSEHNDDTFFEHVKKLPPSHYLKLRMDGHLTISRYWDMKISNEMEGPRRDEQHAEEFRDLLVDAVRIRLRSDVPVGSCLSGGLDSSSIVCIANALLCPDNKDGASDRQKTFSACFDEKRCDERPYIEAVVGRTHADANYVFPEPDGFLRELDALIWHQEEPFDGSSVYAQWEVIKKARERGVKVLLDGQGGDEQLAGYRKFYLFYFLELLRRRKGGRLVGESVRFFSSAEILRTLNVKSGLRYFAIGNRMQRVDCLLSEHLRTRPDDTPSSIGYHGDLGSRMKDDLTKFSLPVLLRFEDKNSMGNSVESRLPFLDYRVVQMLASLPLDQKMRDGWTKFVLRNAMRGILPEKIRLRKSKLGFATPEDEWLRGAIKNDMRETLSNPLFNMYYADTKRVADRFERHVSGRSMEDSSVLFRFYGLELWGRRFIL